MFSPTAVHLCSATVAPNMSLIVQGALQFALRAVQFSARFVQASLLDLREGSALYFVFSYSSVAVVMPWE